MKMRSETARVLRTLRDAGDEQSLDQMCETLGVTEQNMRLRINYLRGMNWAERTKFRIVHKQRGGCRWYYKYRITTMGMEALGRYEAKSKAPKPLAVPKTRFIPTSIFNYAASL